MNEIDDGNILFSELRFDVSDEGREGEWARGAALGSPQKKLFKQHNLANTVPMAGDRYDSGRVFALVYFVFKIKEEKEEKVFFRSPSPSL